MSKSIAEIKRENGIEQVAEELGVHAEGDFTLDIDHQTYTWQGRSGDVIDLICQRFDWSKGQALRYLKNRAKAGPLPPVEIAAAPAPAMAPEMPSEFPADEWLTKAIIRDRTNFLATLWQLEGSDFFQLASSIPDVFTPLIGRVDDFAEMCCFCGENFTGRWAGPGDAYLALEEGGFPARGEASVYCGACVKRFRVFLLCIDRMLAFRFGKK